MNDNIKILIVEDEDSIREFIKINLKRNDFSVVEAASGEEAIEKLKTNRVDFVILDIMLPGIDGYEVCRRIREEYEDIAIIMLTAKGQDMDKIIGLDFGADDYMVKPFNPLELVARIRAILRRMNKYKEPKSIIEISPFKLYLNSKEFYKDNILIDLTFREFNMMKIFLQNPNKTFSRDELLNLAWGEEFFGDVKTVDVHIRRLREKIEENPSKPDFLKTIWGHGYSLKERE